jgi:hypothetical protein
MPDKGAKLFPDDVRTIEFSNGKLRTTITARIIFRNEGAMAAVPAWVRQRTLSSEAIMLKENLFVDSHLVYNTEREECLRILDWFPGLVDRGGVPAQETLIQWKDIKAFKAQTETEPVQ